MGRDISRAQVLWYYDDGFSLFFTNIRGVYGVIFQGDIWVGCFLLFNLGVLGVHR